MGMANSTGNPPDSYPAEHFIGKPGCQCEPCRAWFDGWNAGHAAGRNDERATEDRKDRTVSLLRSIVSEAHAAGDRATLGEALDALCALAGSKNALMTRGARKLLAKAMVAGPPTFAAANNGTVGIAERCREAEGHLTTLVGLEGHCVRDHNGNCQEHYISNPCPVAEARAFLVGGTKS